MKIRSPRETRIHEIFKQTVREKYPLTTFARWAHLLTYEELTQADAHTDINKTLVVESYKRFVERYKIDPQEAKEKL